MGFGIVLTDMVVLARRFQLDVVFPSLKADNFCRLKEHRKFGFDEP